MGELLEKGYLSSSRGLLDQETRSLPSWMLIEIPRETIMLLTLLGRRRHLNAQEQDHLEIHITESKLTPTRLNNSNGGSVTGGLLPNMTIRQPLKQLLINLRKIHPPPTSYHLWRGI